MPEYCCYSGHELNQEKKRAADLLQTSMIESKAALFKILGDCNRLKIIELLMNYDKLCVFEIAKLIDVSIATTSHHLITLKNYQIIHSHKEGKHVIYSLNNPLITDLIELANRVDIPLNGCL